MMTEFPAKPRIFYGYYLVALTFLFMVLINGCGVYAFSLFVRPLEGSLGWGRSSIMGGFTVFYLAMAVTSPLAGRLVDRYGARAVIPVGAALMCLGFLLVSRMTTFAVFYIAYAIVGAGASHMGPVPCSAVISNWFVRKRGMAIGLMSAGYGVGGLMLAPLVGLLLSHHDWRTAYLLMGVVILAVTVPLSLGLVRTRPEEMCLSPDGDSEPPKDASARIREASRSQGLTTRQSLRTSVFWLIALAFTFSSFAHMGTMQSSAPFLEDIGYPTAAAASALGGIGLGSTLGKILFGWLCDRVRANRVSAIGMTLQLAAVLILLAVRTSSPSWIIAAYAVLLGFGMGAWVPTLSMLASTSFGLLYYGAVFGALYLCQGFGAASGPFFSGLVHDATGSYNSVFVTYAVLQAIAIPTILLARSPSRLAA